jgi:hypothetical protein
MFFSSQMCGIGSTSSPSQLITPNPHLERHNSSNSSIMFNFQVVFCNLVILYISVCRSSFTSNLVVFCNFQVLVSQKRHVIRLADWMFLFLDLEGRLLSS